MSVQVHFIKFFPILKFLGNFSLHIALGDLVGSLSQLISPVIPLAPGAIVVPFPFPFPFDGFFSGGIRFSAPPYRATLGIHMQAAITSSLSSFDGLYIIISSVVFLFMFTGVSPSPSALPFPIFPSLKHMATCLGRQLPSSKEGQICVVPYGHFRLGLGFIVGGGAVGLQPFDGVTVPAVRVVAFLVAVRLMVKIEPQSEDTL